MSKGGNKFVIGAILGMIAGTVAGVLFAPRSGKATRKEIGEKAKEYADKGREIIVKNEIEAKKAVTQVADKISK